MEDLFTYLSRAVEGSAPLALTAALIWGILSIVLSPCHLSSIPLIVGFISEQGELTLRRAFCIASLFSLGILVTIAAIGSITAALGQMLGKVGAWGNYLVAAIFLLIGLHLLDIIPLPFSGPGQAGLKRRGLLAAFLLGLVFGIALGPCTFAYMVPVLAVCFKVGAEQPVYAGLLLTAYGAGHCAVIVAAGTFTEAVERYLKWNERSHGTVILKRICGVLVLAGGVYMIYIA